MKTEQEKYQIITLGHNCFPRVVLTEYNMIKTKRQGRKSMVFDLAGHNICTVINLLNNDFESFFDEITLDNNNNELINIKTDSKYPHDKDCNDSIQKFEQRYTKRIENFRDAIADSLFTFFIIWGEYTEKEIEELYYTLKEKRKENPFKLIVWNYSDNNISFENYNISIYTAPLPENNWQWDNEIVKKEKKSIDYKKSVINFTKNEILKSGFDFVLFKESFFDIFTKKLKIFIKMIFSINNDCTKNIKYLMLFGIKFKIKEINQNNS